MSTTDFSSRMAPADSILWRIESDAILRSTITAVTLLDREPDWQRLRRSVEEALSTFPRLQQIVSEPRLGLGIGMPQWVTAPHFDVDDHLVRVSLPGTPDLQAVLDYAAHEAMVGFDRSRPLWQFTVIDGVQMPDGRPGAAFVQKYHHALADGIASVQLALQLLEATREASVAVADLRQAARATSRAASGATSPGEAATSELEAVRALSRTAVRGARIAARAARDPLGTARALSEDLRWGARLLAPVSQPLSPLMRGRSSNLQFGAFDVDLEELRAAGQRAGGSLNDAFLAAVAAGLRRYHDAHQVSVRALRMTLPVSIRRPEDSLGTNRFTPVRFVVPILPNVGTSIRALSAIVREWRSGPALGLTDGLARALSMLPTSAVTPVFGSMLKNVDFVATNVPGLPVPLYLAGAELVRQYAFAPPSGSALNVALLSHVGTCCIGVNMDKAAVRDGAEMVAALKEGFSEVLAVGHRRERRRAAGTAKAARPPERAPARRTAKGA